MPNWCSNSLTLTAATKEEAQELCDHLSNQEADDWTFFGFFVPETWNEEDWYYSRVNAWGTKWDANLAGYDWVDDYTLVMSFDTAWSPPIAVYEAASEQGWGVVATYYEPGMCFVGSWVDGVDEHYDFQECTSKDVRDVVGMTLMMSGEFQKAWKNGRGKVKNMIFKRPQLTVKERAKLRRKRPKTTTILTNIKAVLNTGEQSDNGKT